MPARIRLGLLDFGELPLPELIQTAELAEKLGFARFWLAEHRFGIENALLVTPLVAAATKRIRVGPAGVLLRYYAPWCVARDGLLLERAFPGRIDLGLAGGRHAAGADLPFLDGRTHLYAPETMEEKVGVVAETVAAQPANERPEVWLLGSSEVAARGEAAARLGAHFCLSLFHASTPPSAVALAAHRAAKGPSNGAIAIMVACVESAGARRRHRTPFPAIPGKPIVEGAAVCRERIEELAHAYGVSEVAILECSEGLERRRESLEGLAAAFRAPAARATRAARGGPTSGPRR